ncbi:hypothetical protein SAMN05660909_01864 [Chitinophaga terrae (ex Kim and Jung 2007)]|uniref:Uncharacterized protein n=1 Tax=Chitinophaga terrae (ex Kim and Jung 2007) TaxID=408074 RepID=A0A1H4B3V7_9BACT|nr:hypothetical protein SAMN05660909_01864 [Chitinophaga terrae (ex Kim and Jung 2007)]
MVLKILLLQNFLCLFYNTACKYISLLHQNPLLLCSLRLSSACNYTQYHQNPLPLCFFCSSACYYISLLHQKSLCFFVPSASLRATTLNIIKILCLFASSAALRATISPSSIKNPSASLPPPPLCVQLHSISSKSFASLLLLRLCVQLYLPPPSKIPLLLCPPPPLCVKQLFFEHEIHRTNKEKKRDEIIPSQRLFEKGNSEDTEHGECDHFLDGF